MTQSVYVCVASDSSETVEVIIVKVCTVTAFIMRMHHLFILLTLIFLHGHTDLNHENNKCLINSETIQAMPTKLAVKIVRLIIYIMYGHCQSVDLDLCSRSQVHLKLEYFLTCDISDNI